jgi:hypothetical protein
MQLRTVMMLVMLSLTWTLVLSQPFHRVSNSPPACTVRPCSFIYLFGMPPLLLPGFEPASPGALTVLTRVRCLSLKPDMDREVRSHPDSRISAKVQS